MSTIETAGRIVVGTDLSHRADRAVDWAAHRASLDGTPLLLVVSLPEVPIPRRARLFTAMQEGDYPAALHERAEHRLTDERERVLGAQPGLTVETAIVTGKPAAFLAAASADAALVVIGARGHTAPARVRVLGGTADAVASHAHGPVAVVTELSDPVLDGPVVVGVDDSEQARAAIRFAVDEAALRGVRLIGLHSFDPTPMVAGAGPWPLMAVDVDPQLEAFVRETMAPALEGHPEVAFEVRVGQARASAALVAASQGASLLVVGSRGRGGFAGLVLGSTSKEVLRDAHCPVVVVRH